MIPVIVVIDFPLITIELWFLITFSECRSADADVMYALAFAILILPVFKFTATSPVLLLIITTISFLPSLKADISNGLFNEDSPAVFASIRKAPGLMNLL